MDRGEWRTSTFISYSRADKDFVRRLDAALSKRNRETWIDLEGIRPTEEWLASVYAGIEIADAFIFVISPDSVRSEDCQRELAHATAYNKRLVPIWYRDVDASAIPDSLAAYNFLYFRESDDFETSFQYLVDALDTDLEWIRFHTRLLTRAVEWDNHGRDTSFVLRGSDLHTAEEWQIQAAEKEPKLTPLQTEYIMASRRAATRRQRITLGAVTFNLIIFAILGLLLITLRYQTSQLQPVLNWTIIVLALAIGFFIGAIVGAWAGRVARRSVGSGTGAAIYDTQRVTVNEQQAVKERPAPEQPDALSPDTIFIAYSREDWNEFVEPLIIYLRQEGLRVWVDQELIPGGTDWKDAIEKALKTCQRMILFVSPDSMESDYVKSEYSYFVNRRKLIIPLICRAAELPWDLERTQYYSVQDRVQLVNAITPYPHLAVAR